MNAVLFSGGPGTDICPEAWDRPRPLWPVGGGMLIDFCLEALAEVGVREAVVASNGSTAKLKEHFASTSHKNVKLKFNEDHRPRGSAGSLADAAGHLDSINEPILLISAACYVTGEQLSDFVRRSLASDAVMTVAYLSRDGSDILPGIYLVKQEALEYTRPEGYQDIKEQLIPTLVSKGLKVVGIELSGAIRPVLTRDQALAGLGDHIQSDIARRRLGETGYLELSPDVWVHETANVDATARLLGPCVIGPRVTISGDVVVSGPVVIESDVSVGADAVIDHSLIFSGSRVSSGMVLQREIGGIGLPLQRRRQAFAASRRPLESSSSLASRKSEVAVTG